MKAIFDYIRPLILAGVPAIKAFKLYRSQDIDLRKRESNDLAMPACLVEFIPVETRNHAKGIKRILLRVRFRFLMQDFKFQKFDQLDFADAFDAFVQCLRADETKPVSFSSFMEANQENDYNPDNMVQPFVDYFTWWTKVSASKQPTTNEHGPINPVVTGEFLSNQLTVDTTEITTDSDEVTADTVIN